VKPAQKSSLLVQSGEKMELAGNREATVDGCGGVLEYTHSVVCVRYGRGVLRFSGQGLSLQSLACSSLIISGYITQIAYAARGELLPPLPEKEE
jgi:hypothetical protein